ncbi:MAG: alpha-amylase family glycosyl hydrolase [Kiritimatiellia bacterium]
MKRFYRAGIAVCLLGGTVAAWGQSSRPGWGSVPYAGASGTGATFRVWAPGAASVSVAGTFNGWNSAANPLALESAASGTWSADVPAARTNHAYKYVVNGSLWRSDPRSRVIDSADNDNSIVMPTNAFAWNGDSASITNASDRVIYEAHVGTFPGAGGTFAAFADRLDDLAELGVTAIELMPINEFPSATSWGYNPAYPFAVEKSYGTPDALKSLVQGAHQRGLMTLMDVVHNHWDGGSSLWEIDGTSPGPYFYDSDPYTYTSWGPRPDYGRAEVRETINDTFRMWLEEYHISGFRWDAPNHILYTTNGIFIPAGLTMVTNALRMMATNYSGIWNIAEDTKEISGFDYHWDLGFAWEIKSVLTQGSDADRDMPTVARNVAGTPARIVFTESHDTTGDLNGGSRLPTAIHAAEPEGYYARKRAQLGQVMVMTSPGTPMIWQGQEVLETNAFSDTRPMDWARTNSQAGNWRLYRDLIRLRRDLDGTSAGLKGDSASAYQVDDANKLIAYSRWDSAATGGWVVVVANFANAVRSNYPVQFPAAGTWYALFNSDSTEYAGDYGDAGNLEVAAAGAPATGPVTIGPYSALIFSQTPRTGMVLREAIPSDQPAGNGDGTLDPGETIRERIVLWNKSSVPATGVVATLTALSPGTTVEQGGSDYGPMAADGSATNLTEFAYRLAPDLACGSVVRLQLATAFNGQVLTNVFDHVVGRSVSQPPATNDFNVETPTPIPDNATAYSEVAIAEPGEPVVTDIDVRLRIDHTYDRDLVLALQHPDGSEVLLVNRRGRSGNDFGTGDCGAAAYTVLDQGAALSITNGTAPFAGTYRPESPLDAFNGKPLNGTWRLRMTDVDSQDAGTNRCWSIRAVSEQRGYDCNAYSNRPPVAHATNLWLSGSAPTNFALAGSDADGQPLTFELRRAPAHGLFALHSAVSGAATYAPVHGYVGTDAVEFAVSDGLLTSATAAATFVMPAPEDSNANGLPDTWEMRYWTNLVSAVPDEDWDNDGASDLAEYRANTDPRDPGSALKLLPFELGADPVLRWASVGGTRYQVEWADDLGAGGFQAVARPLAAEIDPAAYGTASTLSFQDDFLAGTATNGAGMRIYRVRVPND